jgi:predicted N-acetyltransferase YhbS
MNREWGWFGPMGTAAAFEGRGIGRVLLRRALGDLRAAGHRTAVIPWAGPVGFYRRHVPCPQARVFWQYRKRL